MGAPRNNYCRWAAIGACLHGLLLPQKTNAVKNYFFIDRAVAVGYSQNMPTIDGILYGGEAERRVRLDACLREVERQAKAAFDRNPFDVTKLYLDCLRKRAQLSGRIRREETGI